MKKTYVLWAGLAVGVFLMGIILADLGFGVLVSIPSLLIVILPPAFLSLAVFPAREIGGYFRAASQNPVAEESILQRASVYFTALQKYVMYSGLVGAITGLIAMLTFLGEADHVGNNAAIALLTTLYALLINVVIVIPISTAVNKNISSR